MIRIELDLHAKINVRIPVKNEDGEIEHEIIKTTTGRVIFNEISDRKA
ncbi:MAG: hypothetical protein U5K69_03910 [Balneolaceae bacterium]|nr:hypothetical protein [Balneolaceae bacterium]